MNIKIKTTFTLLAIFLSICLLLLIFFILNLNDASDTLREIERDQYLMVEKANELRQSSDDLSKYARLYAITGEQQYHDIYFQILDIRNGIAKRPKNYGSIYWDVPEPIRSQRHPLGAPLSLKVAMNKLPFLPSEFELLTQSEANSNALVRLEVESFNSMVGLFKDNNGRYLIKAEPNRQLAIELLTSEKYHLEKEQIMRPIDDFLHSVLERMAIATANQAEQISLAFKQIYAILLFSFMVLVFSLFIIRKKILEPVKSFTQVISSFKQGDGALKETVYFNDEIGAMVRQFFEMKKRIEESIEQLEISSIIIKNAFEGIIVTDSHKRIISINPAVTHISGYSYDDVIGQNPKIFSSGKQGLTFYKEMWQSIKDTGNWQGEVWNRHKNGALYAERLNITSIFDSTGDALYYVAMFSDITSSKQQQEKLKLLAHYDVLTGLPNRALFADRFKQAVAHSNRSGSQLAICFLDLDNFKPVNDQYGHDVGDQLLIEVAKRITNSIREEDTVSRQGGDEFALLLNDIDTFERCKQTLERIHQTLAEPYIIGEYTHKITASSGVTLYPADSGDIDTLLRHADQAMYKAKLDGKHCYHLFNPENDHHIVQKRKQLKRIEEALNNDEFSLHYQPKVNMVTGEVYGAEALIRWVHPEKGLIPPLDFLPLIEASELEIKVGEWVINQAIQQLDTWQKKALDLELSINISSYHLLSAPFFSQLESAINRHPEVAPQQLQLEILESSALGDINNVNNAIKACQSAFGVTVALDDFGTGYSSLTHLRKLNANVLKIDQSFVRDALDDASDFAIIEGTIGLAAAFNRDIIAEGVETTNHGLLLILMGCKKAQGYGIARPMPADDLFSWLDSYTANPVWLIAGKKSYSKRAARSALLLLIITHSKEAFSANILSEPESVGRWPIMDNAYCPCGVWLKRDKSEKLFKEEHLSQLDQAHASLHLVANRLLSKYQAGDVESARAGLCQLQPIVDEMESTLAQYN